MAGLQDLGLTAVEDGLYRHCLRHPGGQLDEVHLLLQVSEDEVERARAGLVGHGVLDDSDTPTPADPQTAVDRLTDARLRWLQDQIRQLGRTRHLVEDLQKLTGDAPEPAPSIERLTEVVDIRNRLEDLAFFARDEILSIEPYQKLSPANIEHARPLDLRCLRRGVKLRSIVLTSALDDPSTARYLRDLAERGAEVRTVDNTQERVLVYDRTTALVPAVPTDTSRGALLLHDPALVTNLIALFDQVWAAATPIDDATVTTGTPVLTPTELQVLESMCSVSKDDLGARLVGVSVRTYRRHVADVLRTLGAETRPQAALVARERGLV